MVNKTSLMAIFGTILMVLPGVASAQDNEAEVQYERPRDLSGSDDSILPDEIPVPLATSTRCDTLTTICVTSIAVPTVVCTAPAYRTRQCTSAATVGAQGTSPVRLPGNVNWFGDSFSWDGCSAYRATSGFASWPGGLGTIGSGTQTTLSGCTKVSVFVWGFAGCVRVSVDALTSATARAVVSGVTVSSVSNSVYDWTTNQACVTAFGS